MRGPWRSWRECREEVVVEFGDVDVDVDVGVVLDRVLGGGVETARRGYVPRMSSNGAAVVACKVLVSFPSR